MTFTTFFIVAVHSKYQYHSFLLLSISLVYSLPVS